MRSGAQKSGSGGDIDEYSAGKLLSSYYLATGVKRLK